MNIPFQNIREKNTENQNIYSTLIFDKLDLNIIYIFVVI